MNNTTPCPVCGHVPTAMGDWEHWGIVDPCEHEVCLAGQQCNATEALASDRSWNIPDGRWHNGWPVRN